MGGGVFPELRADIAGGASFVSLDLGKGVWNNEPVFLEIYSTSGILLGNSTSTLASPGTGVQTLIASGSSGERIAYALFGARDPTVGSSVYADNFTFEPFACPNVIPAPGAILLGAIGMGLVAHLRRRRAL